MKVIDPVLFQTSHLVSTTATETYSAYDAGTSYSIGNKVVYLTRIYESLTNTNLGNTPSTSPTIWLDISPANQYAMFDTEVNTQTTGATPLIVEVKPGTIINSLSLINLECTSVTVEMEDAPGGNVVYTKTVNLDGTSILDWYMYFFEPYDFLTSVTLTDLPPYGNNQLKVTLTAGVGTVKIGAMIYGNSFEIGLTQYGVGFGIRDYSVKETDNFGNTTFVQRAFSKRLAPQVLMENTRLRYVFKKLENIRSKPTVWIPTDVSDYEPMTIYGFYRDFTIDVNYPTTSLVSLDLESLI